MKIKKVIVILFTLFIIPIYSKVQAAVLGPECTLNEQYRLTNLVNNTRIDYEIYDDKEGKKYSVTISGLTPDFYAKDESKRYFKSTNSDTVTVYNYLPGKTHKFFFYASDTGKCFNFQIMTKMIYLMPYNVYSEDSLCVGHEDFELCKRFTPIKIDSYEDFIDRMIQYLDSIENQNDDQPTDNPTINKGLFDIVMDFIARYYMYFLLGVIVIGTTGIIILAIRRRRSIL